MTMKTTYDLPESLVKDVKKIAKDRGTTVRDLVQQALVRIVEEASDTKPFVLRDMSVPGWKMSDLSLTELIHRSYERD